MVQYQYTCITSSTVLNESELRCDCEAGFGQATSYEIHHPSKGGNLALSHYGGTEKEWEALNLRGFLKIEHYHEKRSLNFTFYEGSTRYGGKA